MKYLPFENIIYRTRLDSTEILKRLGESIEIKKTKLISEIRISNYHKPYEGNIKGSSFFLTRIIWYRNSFLPRIKGVVLDDINGTKIHVRMRIHPFVAVFMFIWFGVLGIMLFIFLISFLSRQNFEAKVMVMGLVPFGMIVVGYALMMGAFKYESIKSKKYLCELFEAEIE